MKEYAVEHESQEQSIQHLMRLQIPSDDKIALWLVRCGLKRATDIQVSILSPECTEYDPSYDCYFDDLIEFIKANGLFYATYKDITRYVQIDGEICAYPTQKPISQREARFGNRLSYCTAKDQKTANRLAYRLAHFDKKNISHHRELGYLFSYPLGVGKLFGECFRSRNFTSFANPIELKSKLEDFPEWHYIPYRVRKEFAYEDLRHSKTWMDRIRNDIPELAECYEKI